ncbi:MAG: hypothetical protein MUF87_05655 [Anaerolineae bacterium]|jgi:hypothetical protein|nr:hypothetical protein [Anaerolineae bacterium]
MHLTPTEAAILRTILYGDVFDYPMTLDEIHHFLISDRAISHLAIESTLAHSAALKTLLHQAEGYVTLQARSDLIPKRIARLEAARRMWDSAQVYAGWLARLPFVRMVALTGSLAMHNPSHAQDDYDYMLITTSQRVWTARALAILLVKWGKGRGVTICPNFVLAQDRLQQDRCDLFIAHEVMQMIPLYGCAVYSDLLHANGWTLAHLANAAHPFHSAPEYQPTPLWQWLKRTLERLLTGGIGDRLEAWEYRRKLRRFAPDLKTPHSAAKLDSSQVKGHFQDHGHRILQQYQERLARYGLMSNAAD